MNRTQLTQRLSGHFLSTPLPETWRFLSDDALDMFLEDNAWEPLENLGAAALWDLIDALVDDVMKIMDGN